MPLIVDPGHEAQPFSTIYADVIARGFQFLDDDGAGEARVKRRINERYQDLMERFPSAWAYADASGTAPLTLNDVSMVHTVLDSTNDVPLRHMDRRELQDRYPDLPDTGDPVWWYFDDWNTLNVYPANTSVTIKVRYVAVPEDLTGDSDEPLSPSRWNNAIIEGATADLHRDNGDYDDATVCEARYEQIIAQIVTALAMREGGVSFIQTTGASVDW